MASMSCWRAESVRPVKTPASPAIMVASLATSLTRSSKVLDTKLLPFDLHLFFVPFAIELHARSLQISPHFLEAFRSNPGRVFPFKQFACVYFCIVRANRGGVAVLVAVRSGVTSPRVDRTAYGLQGAQRSVW